jgi:Fusaric acid resistance protein family
MTQQHVGAFASRAIMRVTGTIAGALVGIWLVNDYTSTPAIFLSVFFFVMAFAGYKYGQVGARQVPYTYFLLGLTTLTVATVGVTDPARAWQIGLDRTEEILLGVISSLLVTSLLWPRYAREEFFEAGRAALKTVSQLVSAHAEAYTDRATASNDTETIQNTFFQELSALRNLQQAGARESTFFSVRLSNYNSFLVSLTSLFDAGLDLSRYQEVTWFLDHMRQQIESLLAAISDEFNILSAPLSPGEKLSSSRMNEAFAAFEEKVHEMRDEGILSAAPLKTAMAFAGHFASLRLLCDGLNNIRGTLRGLPRFDQPLPVPKPHWDLLPTIDWFWVKVGIKGGLAALISIVCLKWIHPPGPANVPTWAWLLIVLGRSFFRLGGTGDLRAFQTALRGSLILAVCAALLVLTAPFLASYAIMNLALFLLLFTAGFLTARIAGITFWMEFTFLTIGQFVALNPQNPVPSQTIIDAFVGMMFGMWIATALSRLLWPVLPQRLLRDNLLALFAQIKALLSGDPHREKIQLQLAILSLEALQAARQIRIAGCSEEERAKLVALIRALQTLITPISRLLSRRDRLPEITGQILKLPSERLEIKFNQMLDAFAECFRQGNCRLQLPTVRGALTAMDDAIQQMRDRNMLAGLPFDAPLRVLDLVEHYHATADALEECGQLLCTLKIQRYWGDCGL